MGNSITINWGTRFLMLAAQQAAAITPIKIILESSNEVSSSNSLSMTPPNNTKSNQFMFAAISHYYGSADIVTIPTGWTLIRNDRRVATGQRWHGNISTYYKWASTNESSNTYTWVFDETLLIRGAILVLEGVNEDDPIGDNDGVQIVNSSATEFPAPSVTVNKDNSLVFRLFQCKQSANDTTENWSLPIQLDKNYEVLGLATFCIGSEFYNIGTAPERTGVLNVTTGIMRGRATSIVIRSK